MDKSNFEKNINRGKGKTVTTIFEKGTLGISITRRFRDNKTKELTAEDYILLTEADIRKLKKMI